MTAKIIIDIKEGLAFNYFAALQKLFGGRVINGAYRIEQVGLKLEMIAYRLNNNFEIVITEGVSDNAIVLDRQPDNDPDFIHINIFKEGQFTQAYSNEKRFIEADSSKGVFVYNALFPLMAEIPARAKLKSVSFKFNREALDLLLPEALCLFDELFGRGEPVAYHMHASQELERLTDDMFYFKEDDFGQRSLVIARGIEAFTNLFFSARKHLENNQLDGLHVDDYRRLLKVKDKLLTSFNEGISIEKLAIEFGVNSSKLKRDFKALYNCSIYQFFTHAKMDEAYRRLKSGRYSVMEVGYDLGYQNLSKFSSMFKKIKGVYPKDLIHPI